MSEWKLLDSFDGNREYFRKNSDGTFTIKRSADISQELEFNAIDRNNAQSGWKGDMHKVASIPLIIVEQWWKELGSDPFSKENRKWLVAKLNSSDFGKLRTKEGNI